MIVLVHSMTGYGRAVAKTPGRTLSAEIRTVNHRYLDVRVHIPQGLLFLEQGIRRLVGERLQRGRVECTLLLDDTAAGANIVRLDESLLQAIADGLQRIREALGTDEPLRVADVVSVPGLWLVESLPIDEQVVADAVRTVVEAALLDVERMRQTEGKALVADVMLRIKEVAALTEQLAKLAPGMTADAQNRLLERVQQLLTELPLDPSRVAQEAALLADRSDISEELARVESHLTQLRSQLNAGGPIGRTLDFLLQELNREWNTIGAKTHDGAAAVLIVRARAEIEKMREQVQNIE